LLQEDVTLLAGYIPCTSVTLIVESSERADPILKQRFRELAPDGVEQGPAPDFRDVFCRLPPEGCLFSVVGAVATDPQNRLVQVLRLCL
jgi:hypothetical protein